MKTLYDNKKELLNKKLIQFELQNSLALNIKIQKDEYIINFPKTLLNLLLNKNNKIIVDDFINKN